MQTTVSINGFATRTGLNIGDGVVGNVNGGAINRPDNEMLLCLKHGLFDIQPDVRKACVAAVDKMIPYSPPVNRTDCYYKYYYHEY
jgi:hypothetical protein